jgi:DNA-binding response OmpR family regulator
LHEIFKTKLLLVEDEAELAKSILEFLTGEGFLVEHAATFEAADTKIAPYQYGCVLIDLMLPGGTGLDLIKNLKKSSVPSGHSHYHRQKFA